MSYPTTRPEWSPVSAVRKDTAEMYALLFRQNFPDWAERCDGRIDRAIKICITPGACKLHPEDIHCFLVRSQSKKRSYYIVDVRAKTCTCPDDRRNQSGPAIICKHRLAIAFHCLGPDWIGENTRAAYDLKNELKALEDERFQLMETFCVLAHTCLSRPELRNDENLAELHALFAAAKQAHAKIEKLMSQMGGD